MSASEVAALVGAVAGAFLAVGLLFAMASLTRTLRSVRTTVEELRRETVPLLGNLRSTVEQANAELARVDGVLDRAESIGTTVDAASRLAYLAFGNPVIKIMALAAGTTRAARRLRRRRGSQETADLVRLTQSNRRNSSMNVLVSRSVAGAADRRPAGS